MWLFALVLWMAAWWLSLMALCWMGQSSWEEWSLESSLVESDLVRSRLVEMRNIGVYCFQNQQQRSYLKEIVACSKLSVLVVSNWVSCHQVWANDCSRSRNASFLAPWSLKCRYRFLVGIRLETRNMPQDQRLQEPLHNISI